MPNTPLAWALYAVGALVAAWAWMHVCRFTARQVAIGWYHGKHSPPYSYRRHEWGINKGTPVPAPRRPDDVTRVLKAVTPTNNKASNRPGGAPW